MKLKFIKTDSWYWPSFHKFTNQTRDLGDYAVLILCWDVRIFKKDNPWKPKKR